MVEASSLDCRTFSSFFSMAFAFFNCCLQSDNIISSLRTTFRKEMHMKLDAMKTNGKQIEEGLATFDLSTLLLICCALQIPQKHC
jgi:hypothetical protein